MVSFRSGFVWFRFATVSFGFVSQRFRLVSFRSGLVWFRFAAVSFGFVSQSTVSLISLIHEAAQARFTSNDISFFNPLGDNIPSSTSAPFFKH